MVQERLGIRQFGRFLWYHTYTVDFFFTEAEFKIHGVKEASTQSSEKDLGGQVTK